MAKQAQSRAQTAEPTLIYLGPAAAFRVPRDDGSVAVFHPQRGAVDEATGERVDLDENTELELQTNPNYVGHRWLNQRGAEPAQVDRTAATGTSAEIPILPVVPAAVAAEEARE